MTRKEDLETKNYGISLPIFKILWGTLAALLIIFAISYGIFWAMAQWKQKSFTTSTPFAAQDVEPPAPRLQTSTATELEKKFDEEAHLLETYGWVDQENGIVHIPIRRALALALKKGFPVRN